MTVPGQALTLDRTSPVAGWGFRSLTPAFMARAATRTSGTKISLLRNLGAHHIHTGQQGLIQDVLRRKRLGLTRFLTSLDLPF